MNPASYRDRLEDACLFYERLRSACHRHRVNLWLPHEHNQPSDDPLDFYRADNRFIEANGLVVAILDHPSHGVGAELAYAQYVLQIPIVAVREATLSRYLEGMLLAYDRVSWVHMNKPLRQTPPRALALRISKAMKELQIS